MAFRTAERKKAKLRLGLVGPSGSGKTYSSLLVAKGIGGRIALIDTENGSGDLYAGMKDIIKAKNAIIKLSDDLRDSLFQTMRSVS